MTAEPALIPQSREALFTPLTIGTMTVPNRIVMAPMTRGMSPGGVPGEDVAAYYRRRAAGHCGLVITEGVAVDHPAALGDAGLDESDVPLLAGDASLAGWRRVTEGVHEEGAKIIAQLWHQGVLRKPVFRWCLSAASLSTKRAAVASRSAPGASRPMPSAIA